MSGGVRIGYAAMLDRFPPAEAVRLAVLAEASGFSGVLASDHFQPWLPQHGEAGFAWSVLGALGQATTGDLGTGASTPGYRWHPAMVAQASATLASLYPGRHWLGLGSGEAISEHIAGGYWPEAPERISRLFEAVEIIKKLFAAGLAGRDAKHDGTWFRLEATRLWTMPAEPPPILIATAGPVTARRAGRTVDGLVTESGPLDRLAAVLQRFDEGAREAGRDPATMPKVLRLHLSWADTDEEAAANALAEWPLAGLRMGRGDIRSPFELEQIARLARPEDIATGMLVSADPDAHRARIQRYADLGFTRIYLHNAGRDQDRFLEVFGRDVLPGIRS